MIDLRSDTVTIPTAEMREAIPVTISFVLNDRAFEIIGTSEPLGILVSSAAFYLGDFDLAVQHGHATVARHHNPVKQALAHKQIGGLVSR